MHWIFYTLEFNAHNVLHLNSYHSWEQSCDFLLFDLVTKTKSGGWLRRTSPPQIKLIKSFPYFSFSLLNQVSIRHFIVFRYIKKICNFRWRKSYFFKSYLSCIWTVKIIHNWEWNISYYTIMFYNFIDLVLGTILVWDTLTCLRQL